MKAYRVFYNRVSDQLELGAVEIASRGPRATRLTKRHAAFDYSITVPSAELDTTALAACIRARAGLRAAIAAQTEKLAALHKQLASIDSLETL